MRRLFVLVLFLSLGAYAEEIEVLKMHTSGHKCRKDDVQLLQFGNDISLIFNRFGIELNQGERKGGHVEAEVCFVTLDLKLPSNYCVDQFDQLFSGGIIKSSRSRGSLLIAYSLGSIHGQTLKQWKDRDPILPEDEDSVFALTFSKQARSACIKGKVRYHALLIMEGSRSTIANDHFVSHIDSMDSSLSLRIR